VLRSLPMTQQPLRAMTRAKYSQGLIAAVQLTRQP
jgi:hypothetical protein